MRIASRHDGRGCNPNRVRSRRPRESRPLHRDKLRVVTTARESHRRYEPFSYFFHTIGRRTEQAISVRETHRWSHTVRRGRRRTAATGDDDRQDSLEVEEGGRPRRRRARQGARRVVEEARARRRVAACVTTFRETPPSGRGRAGRGRGYCAAARSGFCRALPRNITIAKKVVRRQRA